LEHRAHHLEEAIRAFRSVLKNSFERHFASVDRGITGYKARHNLALVYEDFGRLDLAEVQWRQVIAEHSDYRPGWRALCRILMAQGKYVAAQAELQRMESDEKVRIEARLLRAHQARKEGQADRARDELAAALDIAPSDRDALHAWCRFNFENGQDETAEAGLQRMVELWPDDAPNWHNLGLIRFRLGARSKAVTALERALACRPQDQTIQQDLLVARVAAATSAGQSTGSKQPAGPIARQPCRHLGNFVALRPCESCRGNVQQKVFACSHPAHRQTTLAECQGCHDYTPRNSEPRNAGIGLSAEQNLTQIPILIEQMTPN
jgi:Tfp pilus assembly protein PilF